MLFSLPKNCFTSSFHRIICSPYFAGTNDFSNADIAALRMKSREHTNAALGLVTVVGGANVQHAYWRVHDG